MGGDAVCPLIKTREPVTPANDDAVFAGSLGKNLNEPGLLDGNHERLGIGNSGQIQTHGREHGPRGRLRRFSRAGQNAVEAAMVEDPNPLAGNPIGARFRVRPRQRVQHHRTDPGQPELTGQHQPVGASPGNDNVIH